MCNWEVSRCVGSGGNNCTTPHEDVGRGRALSVLGVGGHPANGENFISRKFSPLIPLDYEEWGPSKLQATDQLLLQVEVTGDPERPFT